MRNNDKKVTPLAVAFGTIWLMVSLQYGWGGDHESYSFIYSQLKGSDFSSVFSEEIYGESGFKLLMWMMPSEHATLVLSMGIWCFAMAFFFYHFVPQKWWFLVIVFVFIDRPILMGMTGSVLRMSVANAFLIFAVYGALNNKKVLSAMLIFTGSFFHTSVLIFLPIIFVGHGRSKLKITAIMAIFAFIAIFFMLFPSSWTNLVENIISSTDSLSKYEYYLEDQQELQFKGLSLIFLFYWVYCLSKTTNLNNLEGRDYLMLYYALIRIAFDLFPSVGMSVRFFYYIDVYFFAGIACALNRLPKNDMNKWGLILTLFIMFYYMGFHSFLKTPFYIEHWAVYHPYY